VNPAIIDLGGTHVPRSVRRGMTVQVTPHVHISPVHLVASTAAVVAVFGTLHLLALTSDSRPSRALIALGF